VSGARILRLLAAVCAGALLAAAAVQAVRAQDTSPGFATGGLRAGIDDSAAPSSRSRRTRRTTTPNARPGAPTTYGTPPGSGAGETGYVSTNPPRTTAGRSRLPRLRPGQETRPPAAGARAPRTQTAPARPGSPNTGPSRPGASIDIPAGTATPPILRKRLPVEDPFEPVGIRAGSFILRPALEWTTGYDTNPGRTLSGTASAFNTWAPELLVRSDWSRHALNADLRGTYTAYGQIPSLNRPFLDAKVNGRIDVARTTRIDLEARTTVSTDNPGSPDLPADLAKLPIYTTIGATAGVTQQFNRFEVGLKGSIDRVTYDNSELTDGTTVSNRGRNYNQYAAQLRAAYELTPGMKPFVEATFDTRVRDLPVDAFGVHRDSQGAVGRVGTTFEFSRVLTGEFSIGYLNRSYQDPTLKDFHAFVMDGSLIWTATALTTVKLTARSTADESTLVGVSGVLRRDFGVQMDHAFRRWLIGTARIGYGHDDYEGSPRKDDRYVASAGLIYKLNREVQVKAELRREWMRSNTPGFDYTANIALVGLRLQR
jgi:hypothetical protein